MNREEQMRIAQTILEQLGGRAFLSMTGAKDLLATKSGLRFKLPARFAKAGINMVTITLTPLDTYSMKFEKTRGFDRKTVSEFDGIYFDQLKDIFRSETGLYTTL